VIGEVPLPVALQWTATRDLARPPEQTFRDWWAGEHASAVPAQPAAPEPLAPEPTRPDRG